MQLTRQNQFARSFSGGWKMMNGMQSCTQFSESEMQMPWDSQSVRNASRMVNGDGE